MGRERTPYERMVDNALLVSLWSLAQDRSPDHMVGDRIKATKITFLAAYPLYHDRIKAFNFEFFRYTRGPMAKHLTATAEELRNYDMAYEDEDIVMRERGLELGRAFYNEVLDLPQNKIVGNYIYATAEGFGPKSQEEVLEHVYSMQVRTLQNPMKRTTVKNVKMNDTFTRILEDEDEPQQLYIPPGWEMTLELAFNPTALSNLQSGIEDTYEGRVLTADEFWSTV
jgi:hypothetical protein